VYQHMQYMGEVASEKLRVSPVASVVAVPAQQALGRLWVSAAACAPRLQCTTTQTPHDTVERRSGRMHAQQLRGCKTWALGYALSNNNDTPMPQADVPSRNVTPIGCAAIQLHGSCQTELAVRCLLP
jgi:hypothetical protein